MAPVYQLFEGAREKLGRAKLRAAELKSQIGSFLNTKHYAIEQVPDGDAGEWVALYRVVEPLPLSWSTTIGEIAHGLRSALDHAVYELTVINNGAPLENTEFPIFEDESKYGEVDKKGRPTRRSGLFKIRGTFSRGTSSYSKVSTVSVSQGPPAGGGTSN